MSTDIKAPFEEFAYSVLAEYQTTQMPPGSKMTARIWMEQMKRAHDAWHDYRKPKRRSPEVFTPPSPAELTAYSLEIGYPLDGIEWCLAYQTKGWCTSGTTKMRDWKAAVRKWKAAGYATKHRPSLPTTKAMLPEPPGWGHWTMANLPSHWRGHAGPNGPALRWDQLNDDERKAITAQMFKP